MRDGVVAEMADKLFFVTEHHAPHRGVYAIGADEQIGMEYRLIGEGDAHSVSGVLDVRCCSPNVDRLCRSPAREASIPDQDA